jgi:class 3 adenylate cyclase
MDALLGRLLSIGLDPDDEEDQRLRKFLLVVAALSITPLSVVWGAIYWLAGAPFPALIPWLYAVISLLTLIVFRLTRSYPWLAVGQLAPYVTFPFVLMWALGGFVSGSAVAIWASLGPIVALLLGHRIPALLLAVEYAALTVASALIPAPAAPALPDWLRQLYFVLNLAAVPLLAWLLVRVFAGGREGALVSVRGIVDRYFPPELVRTLIADPSRAELGGQIAEVTVLFADLGGYSTYAERRAPAEVVELLNHYFAVVLPAILEEGGLPTQLPGDAVMAVFGAPHHQPDHAARACRAARAILERTERFATASPPGPRFHIGINSGPALVGNIGSEDYRNFTAIGDTVNIASRLQGLAQPGQAVVGGATAKLLGGGFAPDPLGSVTVKGRAEPVEAYALRLPRDAARPAS